MMKYLFFILLLLPVGCGLPYCKKVKLTEDDLLWINHFKANDTIYYLSNQNNIDTVIVKDVQIYNPKNTFIFDTEGQNWLEGDNEFYGFATVELSLIHFTDTFFIRFEIERIAILGALRSSCNFCEWSWINKKIHVNAINIQGQCFKNCISMDIKKMERNKGDQPHIGLKSVIWDKEKGLIQYSLLNGISYTIISAHKQY